MGFPEDLTTVDGFFPAISHEGTLLSAKVLCIFAGFFLDKLNFFSERQLFLGFCTGIIPGEEKVLPSKGFFIQNSEIILIQGSIAIESAFGVIFPICQSST